MSVEITLDRLNDAAPGDQFPVVDLAGYVGGEGGALADVAAQFCRALESVGFLIVVNHGVALELTDGIVAETARFHALPMEDKLRLATGRGAGTGFTGYLPSGAYSVKTSEVNDNDQPDLNEAFFVDRERAPDDPEVLAGKLFREPKNGPMVCPAFAMPCCATGGRWRRFRSACCRSSPSPSTCRRVISTRLLSTRNASCA